MIHILSLFRKLLFFCLAVGMFLSSANFVFANNETQEQLEQELKDIQLQIDQFTKDLSKTQSQKASLSNKIKELQTKQKTLNLQVKQTSVKLTKISGELSTTEKNVKVNLFKQEIVKEEVAQILRQINTSNDNNLVQIFSIGGLSGVFSKIQEFSKLTSGLNELLQQQRVLVVDLKNKQEVLEDQKSEVGNLLKISTIQKGEVVSTLSEQNTLLIKTKGLESNYQAAINDKKKRAAEIRNRIYELFNTGKQIDFGQAVDIAKLTGQLSGVRPALLLAILTQESNLGKNVGTCNRAGDPESKSWKVIMKPTRDQKPFIEITSDLGLDIDTTPVSCPMRDKNGGQVGWGGAMGPAQFIPSTWMGYKDKVASLSGKGSANPWDIRDAFLASAIKLKNDGADGTENGEWKAAMKYFAGSVNLKFRFYGDNVMATAKKYQADIDSL